MKKISVFFFFCLSGCALVFTGANQDISFDSNVKGVSVYIDGAFACTTPCSFPVEKNSGTVSVMAKKRGYETSSTALKTEFNPLAFTGITTYGLPLTTDVVKGTAWKYRQDGVYFDMVKETMSVTEMENVYKNRNVKYFVLTNYENLKKESVRREEGEYLKALSSMTDKSQQELKNVVRLSKNEVDLANSLTR